MPSGHGSRASARCPSMAAWIADLALSNSTKNESPWVLCSVPPFAANAARRSSRWRSLTVA